ncbi:hypothetical protein GCM10009745_11060 [Kribbella yunnanensis]|uniref:Uncharacterized protein n=1 Tax=Kribbella yunnanensis TaxID=190194 RepID=A0ABP4SE69_9ACTN
MHRLRGHAGQTGQRERQTGNEGAGQRAHQEEKEHRPEGTGAGRLTSVHDPAQYGRSGAFGRPYVTELTHLTRNFTLCGHALTPRWHCARF